MSRTTTVLRTLSVLLVASCASDIPSAPLFSGTTVEILGAPSDGVLLADGEVQLTAVVRSAAGAAIASVSPIWSSTDASRATVTVDGRVVGVSPGEVGVRVNAAGATDERALSVRTRIPVPNTGSAPLITTLLDGAMRIAVSAGASGGAVLHVRAVADTVANARVVSGSSVEIGPSGLTFSGTVTLALRYPPTVAVAEQPYLRLHRLTNGVWSQLPGGSVDLDARRVQAAITRTGMYALLRSTGVATLRIDAGDGQRELAGTFVDIAPRVMLRDAADQPVQGSVVRFFVSAGGGAIVGEATSVSNAEGRATLPGQWRLGPTSTHNALTAEVIGSSVAPVTFTATGETLSLVITRDLAGAVSGRTATTQPQLEFRTGSGTVLPVSDGVTVELLSGSGTLAGTLRVDAVNGVATFNDIRINGSGAHQLRFRSGGRLIDGGVFTVTQELATLEILTQPGGAEEDKAFTTQPVIQLLDDAGLPYLPEKEVTAAIASGPGDLRGSRTVVSSAGRATFTNLRITDDGMHRLRFETSAPTRIVVSNQFNVIDD